MNKATETITYRLANKKKVTVKVTSSVAQVIRKSNNKAKWQLRTIFNKHSPEGYCEGISELSMREYYAADTTADAVEQLELSEQMEIALAKLSETHRRRLAMHYFKNLTNVEIATIERVSESAVRQSIKVALKKIKKFF